MPVAAVIVGIPPWMQRKTWKGRSHYKVSHKYCKKYNLPVYCSYISGWLSSRILRPSGAGATHGHYLYHGRIW